MQQWKIIKYIEENDDYQISLTELNNINDHIPDDNKYEANGALWR